MKQLITICCLGLAITSMAAEPGRYKNAQGEEFFLSKEGMILVTQLRQVGGPGGFSEKPLVSYPTVCKFNELGKVTTEERDSLTYRVSYVQLIQPASQEDAERCVSWAAAMNAYAETNDLAYSLSKNEFKKLN